LHVEVRPRPLKAAGDRPDDLDMEWHAPGLIAPSNRTPSPRFVTDVVLELGLASPDDVHGAVEAAKTSGGRPEAVLVQHGVLDDERLAYALAERYGLDRLDLDHFPVDPGAAALVSVETALRHEALPVAHVDGGRLLVALADPAGGPAAAAIGKATGREVVPAVAPRHRLRALIEATASRVAVLSEMPVEEAPPMTEHPPAAPDDSHRVAELEHELLQARRRLDGAEERLAAATARVLELEGELERAAAMLAAVRAAVGVAA
jgi:Type II secretion system (T2SS), protein E, N-terminal domain